MNKCAVVTGANGFIGKRVVERLLANGYFVYAITTDVNSLNDISSDSISTHSLFFDEYPKMLEIIDKDVDLFIHCAWQGVWGKAFDDYSLQMNNAINAGKTMEIASRLNAKKFVLLSTVNVLEAKKIINNPFNYKQLRATTNYAMAKLSAEMICRTLASHNCVLFNCAYIGMVYGENNYSMMVPNVVISKLLKNESPDLIEGNGLYDIVYVEDVANGLIAIGEKGIPFKSYYIGSRHIKTFKCVFEKIGKIVNPSVRLNFGAYPDNNYIDYSLINIDELFEDTGFEIADNFEQNVTKTANWIKEKML